MGKDKDVIYRDPNQPIEARVKDLLSRMTVEEKAAQLDRMHLGGMGGLLMGIPEEEIRSFMVRMGAEPDHMAEMPLGERPKPLIDEKGNLDEARLRDLFSGAGFGMSGGVTSFEPRRNAELVNAVQKSAVEDSRLGIPLLNHGEALHGHVSTGATIFPQAIAMGSTWDTDLVGRIGRAIGSEARAVGVHSAFAPVLDLGREPRWGRTEETYGEDPYLAARMGVAMIKGMQGERLTDPDSLSGGAKHFGGHGEPLGGRDSNMEGITERDLREIHFQTFRAAVKEAGTKCVMAAYHAIDGVPCHANHWLLTEVLREEWGFDGYVVSDASGIEGLYQKHRVAEDWKDAVRQTLEAGVEVALAFTPYSPAIVELVHEGRLSQETLDKAVGSVLRLKFALGLFEDPYVDPERAAQVCSSDEHRALARQAAREAMVLLKNADDLLPLAKDVSSILVAGPNADAPRNQLGDYSGTNDVVTVLEGIRNKVGPETTVRYARGCGLKDPSTDSGAGIAEAVEAAEASDLAILVLGESSWTEGMTGGEGNDRAELDLPGVQQQLLEAVVATGTPVVLVLVNGRPLTIPWAVEHVPAIVEAWYPGQEGGNAVADVLWGDYNPGGKLPITFPRTVGQLPLYYNYKPSGRAYDYVQTSFDPQFPFGFGLSYTTFAYRDLTITPETIAPAGRVPVEVTVENTGNRAGDEVVQLYLRDLVSSVVTPVKQLKGFRRVTLEPGESRTVSFELGPKELQLLDRHLEPVVEPGTFQVV